MKQRSLLFCSFISLCSLSLFAASEPSMSVEASILKAEYDTFQEKYSKGMLNPKAWSSDIAQWEDLGAGNISLIISDEGAYFLGGIRRVFGLDKGTPKFKLSIGGKVEDRSKSIHEAFNNRRCLETFRLLPLIEAKTMYPGLYTIAGGVDFDDRKKDWVFWGPYVTIYSIETGIEGKVLKASVELANKCAKACDSLLGALSTGQEMAQAQDIFLQFAETVSHLDKNLIEAVRLLDVTDEVSISDTKMVLFGYTKTLQFMLATKRDLENYLALPDANKDRLKNDPEYRNSEEYKKTYQAQVFENRIVLETALKLLDYIK